MKSRMTEYMLSKGGGIEQLTAYVSGLIREGWQPFGPVVADGGNLGIGTVYIQTLVKWGEE